MMFSAYLLRRLRLRMAARAAYEAARDAEIEPDDLDISVDLLRELVEQATRVDPRTNGPDDPCTCEGCWACTGHVKGCTCDIAWDCEHVPKPTLPRNGHHVNVES